MEASTEPVFLSAAVAPSAPSAAPLLSLAELGIIARQEIAPDDGFAGFIIAAASEAVRAAAQQPTWTAETAPLRARQICGHLAARSYLNPDSVQYQGAIGPIGGDRIVEDLARALHLTDVERAELAAMSPSAGQGGGLWIQPVGSTAQQRGDIYLPDDTGSDWWIPYLADDDFEALG